MELKKREYKLSDFRIDPQTSSEKYRDGGSLQCFLLGPGNERYELVYPIKGVKEFSNPEICLGRWEDENHVKTLTWDEAYNLLMPSVADMDYQNILYSMVVIAKRKRSAGNEGNV